MTPRILAFRPRERVRESLEQAKELGVFLKVIPLLVTRVGRSPRLDDFLKGLAAREVDYAVFSSPGSFRFLQRASSLPKSQLVDQLSHARVVAIGDRTAEELRTSGLNPIQPAEFSSQGLLEFLCRDDITGRSVALLRSSEGRRELPDGLRSMGAHVVDVPLYELQRIEDVKVEAELKREVLGRGFHGFAFTSSLIVRTFFSIFERHGLVQEVVGELGEKAVGAIGRPTTEALDAWGIRPLRPSRASFRDLLALLKDHILAKSL
ncbi:MAG: uroporphyrinogen-III synthase [Thermoplasmata archaeon]